MESWKQQLNLAVRQLWRNPGFVLTVVLTLALSIGANTAIFSLVNALMLKNPPYPHPERMGTIYTRVIGPTASDERNRLDGEKWVWLRDRVPEGAEGFVVASAGSAVVDLGTEFALNVETDGKARVMVFEGLAEAALLDRTGSPTPTQLVAQSKAFELDPHTGLIAEAVAHPEGFVTAPGRAAARLALDPDYAATILSAHPLGYWRFETVEGSAVPNEPMLAVVVLGTPAETGS